MRPPITAHCVCRNEPFIYYSIRSVYDFVDKILMYDTGSYDAHTLADIQTLIAEDKAGKITFKRVPIDVDETKWTLPTLLEERAKMRGKKVVGHVRKQQLDDTTTPFFFIIDGDEVHYRQTMAAVLSTLDAWPAEKICGFVPSLWFKDMQHVINFPRPTRSGRVFLTAKVGLKIVPLGEMATNLETGKSISIKHACSFLLSGVKPFCHFEPFLKPWRQREAGHGCPPFSGVLPAVMRDNPYYVQRFLKAQGS